MMIRPPAPPLCEMAYVVHAAWRNVTPCTFPAPPRAGRYRQLQEPAAPANGGTYADTTSYHGTYADTTSYHSTYT